MKKSIQVLWKENMKFESIVDGHKIVVDALPEVGGNDEGPRPKTLLMLALAGCTGMDVVSILKKMQVEFTGFDIKIEGELNEEHPKKYTSMKIIYEIKGTNVPYDKVEKAVKLSQEKYCSVSANFRDAMALDYEIKIL